MLQIVSEGEEGELVAGQVPGGVTLEPARRDDEREQDKSERDASSDQSPLREDDGAPGKE